MDSQFDKTVLQTLCKSGIIDTDIYRLYWYIVQAQIVQAHMIAQANIVKAHIEADIFNKLFSYVFNYCV